MRSFLRNPRVWLGILVSVVFVYFAVRGVVWRDLAAALREADYGWILPAAVVVVVGQLARTWRWQALFGEGARPAFAPAFDILNIGYLVSAVFPLRLGDPVRAWLIDTRTPVGGAHAFATVMVERAIDFLMVAVLLAVWVPRPAATLLRDGLGPGPWADPTNLTVIALALVAAVYAGLWVVSSLGPRAGQVTGAALERVGVSAGLSGRATSLVSGFASGFAPLRRPRAAVTAGGWSLGVWLLGALSTWLMMFAFDLRLSYTVALFTICSTALFAILPSSPGYVGVFHSAVILALATAAAVPKETALGYAIVLHGMTIIVLLVLGVASLAHLGLSRQELARHLQSG